MHFKLSVALPILSAVLLSSLPAWAADPVKLVIESWRQDDLSVWQDTILPVFNKEHPDIQVVFQPTINTDYSTALATKIKAGTAGDLIMVEPYDFRLPMYQAGDLAKLNGLPGLENFSDLAKAAWSTDDGKDIYGVPLEGVIHAFIYNADILNELGLKTPTTEAEFLALLKAVKDNGKYTPLALGTGDSFVPGLLGFQLIGPAYWHGEDGRKGLIDGTQKFTDPQYVATWDALKSWIPYLPDGYQSVKYADMQNLFTLGKAAVYPAGSWEIPIFNKAVDGAFKMGVFAPPVPAAGDKCYIDDMPDAGMAMNAHTANPEQAKTFLQWMTTEEFAKLWSGAMPGFFPLSTYQIPVTDPLATAYLGLRKDCASTPRISYQIISRGTPNTDSEISRVTALVVNGQMAPADAAKTVQDDLAGWYKPQQGK